MLPDPLPEHGPFRLPDVRRPALMPSLPGWVASLVASMRDEVQREVTGTKWRSVPTLPQNLMLRTNERKAIREHVEVLDELCGQTPEQSPDCEAAVLVVLTQMMMVFPSPNQNEQ